MTRTARYNAETNTFRELPEMEKPDPSNILGGAPTGVDYEILDELMDKYLSHKNSLREIPGHESCRSVFKDQWVYEEGKDYKLYQYEDRLTLAYPISKNGEDELWEKIFLFMHKGAQGYKIISGINHPGLPNDKTWHEDMISELKKYFTITPR